MKEKIIKLIKPYQKNIIYDHRYKWDKIAFNFMIKCNSILDIGCGTGEFISLDPKRIMGVDHNKKSLEICRKEGFSVECAEATNLPFENNSFDAVHCSHVIEHLLPEDAYKLLKEMNRVLKIGGIFCLRTPLLYRNFYSDLTHIKPYYPQAILHYIRTEENNQRTFEDIDGFYKKIKLKYRREQLFPSIKDTPLWFLWILFNFLYRFGLSNTTKTGYMLVLKKIR